MTTRGFSERWRQVKFLLLGLPFGIGVGYGALTTLSPPAARFLLGLVIVGYVAWTTQTSTETSTDRKKTDETLPQQHPTSDLSSTSPRQNMLAVSMGMCSGFLNATFGTGAPPLLIYSREASWDPNHFRPNMQLIFLITNI
eukprot:7986924-Ditylum_brightwellii.AAC.1